MIIIHASVNISRSSSLSVFACLVAPLPERTYVRTYFFRPALSWFWYVWSACPPVCLSVFLSVCPIIPLNDKKCFNIEGQRIPMPTERRDYKQKCSSSSSDPKSLDFYSNLTTTESTAPPWVRSDNGFFSSLFFSETVKLSPEFTCSKQASNSYS